MIQPRIIFTVNRYLVLFVFIFFFVFVLLILNNIIIFHIASVHDRRRYHRRSDYCALGIGERFPPPPPTPDTTAFQPFQSPSVARERTHPPRACDRRRPSRGQRQPQCVLYNNTIYYKSYTIFFIIIRHYYNIIMYTRDRRTVLLYAYPDHPQKN